MRVAVPLLALLAAGLAAVAEPPKPALTAQELTDGWVSLFDGETTFGWKIDGPAEVKDGVLVLGTGKKATAYPTTDFGDSFEYSLEVRGAGRIDGPRGFSQFDTGPRAGWGRVVYSQSPGSVSGSALTQGASSTETGDASKRPELASAPLLIETDGKTPLEVRAVKLRPVGAKPIFNGKDLTGWKLFEGDAKRAKSKVAVTPAGEIGLKDGPGDLQTTTTHADFVLQLECKTNGKGLNSGVFFRCLPNEYQNGYEMQIQNLYVGDRTKPADFGTGAIYRRVPARKVVADDGEWFGMTLVARGNHISTWVNGYQTVDWTDDRPADPNPRKGSKGGAGHLSLQGHDPTTDLLFRNLRLADLPARK
jgi:hypothetical protein